MLEGNVTGMFNQVSVDPSIDGRWSMINLHWHGRALISAAAVQSKPAYLHQHQPEPARSIGSG